MSGERKRANKKKKVVSEPEDEYVVEAIMDKRMEDGQPKYLVKWKDWPHSSNTWEPVSNLTGCPELLKEFERTFKVKGSDGPPPKKKEKKNAVVKEEPNGDSSVYDSDVEEATESKSNSIDVDVLEECPADREAEELLGVVPINNIMTYLVKWKPKKAGAVGEADMNLVKGDIFKERYPNVVIEFYEKHIIWSRDERLKTDVTRDGLLEADKVKIKKQLQSTEQSGSTLSKVKNPFSDTSSVESDHGSGSEAALDMEVDSTLPI